MLFAAKKIEIYHNQLGKCLSMDVIARQRYQLVQIRNGEKTSEPINLLGAMKNAQKKNNVLRIDEASENNKEKEKKNNIVTVHALWQNGSFQNAVSIGTLMNTT